MRRYGNHRARDAVRDRVLAEEDICYLCGLPVDKSLPRGNPMAPEIDDIIPVSKGGNPIDRNNLRLTHRCCNRRKSNHPLGIALMDINEIKTKIRW